MLKYFAKALIFLMASALLMSCAVPRTQLTPADFKAKSFEGETYKKKVDNFMVILDSSQSMGKGKLDTAVDIVNRMNQTIPDIQLNGALRTFGEGTWSFMERTDLLYGLTGYTKSGLEDTLKNVVIPLGLSPLNLALASASEDLSSAQGKIAVIVVSDGEETQMDYASAICTYILG